MIHCQRNSPVCMYLISTLLFAFFASLLLTFCWLKLATFSSWFDVPNQRSSHTIPTPKSGGVGFSLVYIGLSIFLYQAGYLPQAWFWVMATGLILMIAGFVDDLFELAIITRLVLQLLSVLLALYLLPALPALPLPGYVIPGSLGMGLLLAAAWVWLVNLYNFMDGIDALAAAEAIFIALALAGLAALSGVPTLGFMSVLLAAVLGGFLYFNLPPARIFMGDAGSNFLGFVLGALGILAVISDAMTIWTLLILFGVFIVDSTATLFKRMWAGLVWYHGHRSHAYQCAAELYGSHAKVVLGISCINVFWLLPLAWISTQYADSGILLTLLAWLPLLICVNKYQSGKINGSAGH